jgi:predicted nuclease of restriction endonuclease-like (RecB) superfamily
MTGSDESPVALTAAPPGYVEWLSELKNRIHTAQQRAAAAVNTELVMLYWQIGRDVLERQSREGWGAKVLDRLALDLRAAFPDMKGFSVRNLRYMRNFAEAWPDPQIVQQAAAQLPWFHLCTLLDKLKSPKDRDWYLRAAIEHNWSRNVLVHQIELRTRERTGKAITNFSSQLNPTIGLLLCKRQNRVVAEYALRDLKKPIGVTEYQLVAALPQELESSLPSIEQIERELGDMPPSDPA